MSNQLDQNYQLLLQFNPKVADTYYYRTLKKMEWKVIARETGFHINQLKIWHKQALSKLKNKDTLWMGSLSSASQKALLRNNKRDLFQLHKEILVEKLDLETLPGIGHKKAQEILSYIKTKLGDT